MMGAGFIGGRRELPKRSKTWCLLVTLLVVSFTVYKNPRILARDIYNESNKTAKQTQCKSSKFNTGIPMAPSGHVPSCGGPIHAEARKLWLEAEERYSC